ncbi:MAG: CHAT domain-containing protein [Phaeodactylibacter sp.]|nr:CHAT domain-containing protein [Phaeodactylibacter sp.]
MKAQRMLLLLFWIALSLLFWVGCQNEETAPTQETLAKRPFILNDSMYVSDSLNLLGLHEKLWYYINNGKMDSVENVGVDMAQVAGRMLEYREDSSIRMFYYRGTGSIRQGRAYKGDYSLILHGAPKEEMEWLDKVGPHKWRAESYSGASAIYASLGDYESAIFCQKKSLEFVEQVMPEGHYYHSNNYSNLGHIYLEAGDVDQALYYFHMLLSFYTKYRPSSLSVPKRLLATAYMEQKDYQKALEYCLESINSAASEEDEERKARNLGNSYLLLGKIYGRTEAFGQAEAAFAKAFSFFRDSPSGHLEAEPNIIRTWEAMSRSYKLEKCYQDALAAQEQALAISKAYYGEKNIKLLDFYLEMGQLLTLMDELEGALMVYQQALHQINPDIPSDHLIYDLPSVEFPTTIIAIELLKARATTIAALFRKSEQMVHEENVFAAFNLAQDFIDKLLSNLFTRSAQSKLAQNSISFYEQGLRLSWEKYSATGKEKYLEWAFQFAEKSKSSLSRGIINGGRIKDFAILPDSLLKKESDFKLAISLYENSYYEEKGKPQPDSQKLANLEENFLMTLYDKNNLENQFKQKYPQYYQLKYQATPPDIKEIQRFLESGQALVEYFMGDSMIYVLAFSREKVYFERVPSDSLLLESIGAVRTALSTTPSKEVDETGFQPQMTAYARQSYLVFQRLLEPSILALGKKEWIIVPDGQLSYLPFDALAISPLSTKEENLHDFSGLDYLARHFTTWQEYSAASMLQRKQKKPKGKTYAGFAPAYEGDELTASRGIDTLKNEQLFSAVARSGLQPLTYNRPEVEDAAQHFNGEAFLGHQAQESVYKEYGGQSQIVHLAAHALTSDEEPLYSQLLFSKSEDTLEDGRLHAFEIYNTRLDAELAVLSACNTGAGKLQRGEGVMSLARAFRYAGCPNIVMSLWKADDYSTKEVISVFFEKLSQKANKADALRQAKLSFLNGPGHEAFKHPYYWAGLTLIGDNTPVIASSALPSSLWIGVVLLGLCAGLFYFLRKRWILRE